MSNALTDALLTLPPKTRLALHLLREGNDYPAIGKELGMPARKARRLVERALEYLLEAVPACEREMH